MFFPALGLIEKSVGNNLDNREDDVLRVKSKLAQRGLFDNRTEPEPHGIITRAMDDGIKTFQRERGLKVDGLLFPGGETESTLAAAAPVPKRKPEPPKQEPKPQEEPKDKPDFGDPKGLKLPPEKEEKQEKPDCTDLKLETINAENKWSFTLRNFRKAGNERKSLQSGIKRLKEKISREQIILQDKQLQLAALNTMSEQEKQERKDFEKAGTIIGRRFGLPGKILGGAVGRAVEETMDLFKDDQTTLNLNLSKSRLIKEIETIKNTIIAAQSERENLIREKIEIENALTTLESAVQNAENEYNAVKAQFDKCLKQKK